MIECDRPIKELLRPAPIARDALWRKVQRRRARARRSAQATSAVAALGAIALAGLWMQRAGGPDGPQASHESVDRGGALLAADGRALDTLSAEAGRELALRLADGSGLTLAPGAVLRTRSSNAHLHALTLERGSATFDVVPGGPRRWEIGAGRVQVIVLGTRFRVTREPSRIEVAVERGRVQVLDGAPGSAARVLSAGETWTLPGEGASSGPSTRTPPARDSASGATRPESERAPAVWSAREAPVSAGGSAKEGADRLLQRADSARASGLHREAERLMERFVADHPSDARAPLVALTLGRLQLDRLERPARAARTLERAVALGLPSAVAEEGAARLVEAYAKSGQRVLAQRAAASYRQRFPSGARQASVEAWLGATAH